MDYGVIWGAVIEAIGVVVAAFISVKYAGKIVMKGINSYFLSYSDKSFSHRNVVREAKHDVFIVTGVGNNFLKEYKYDIEDKLKSGLHVRYILLDQGRFKEMERYLHGDLAKDISIHNEVVAKLKCFQKRYPTLFEFRYFHGYMTASYICADIWPSIIQDSGWIQIMLYQYNVRPKSSPIVSINPKSDEKGFIATVNSINDMWQKSDTSPKPLCSTRNKILEKFCF